uniref:N-ethylmaleimide-sensitive factor attachment protein, beta b n=1 Tax=Oryzias latipes TaxID=8090 RepID=A0A3P9I335_ORYLA
HVLIKYEKVSNSVLLTPTRCGLQLPGAPSARPRVSTCRCRTNTTAPRVSSTQETPTRSLTPTGRFTIAAKHHISIAEIYESELVDIEKAIAHYEQAADYYKGEESNSSANKCLLKVGAYCAQLEQYQKAIEIYEQVGATTMDNPLLKYSAKEYFFKASLCHFIVDELNAKIAVEKYEEMFPAFSDSRECKLLKVNGSRGLRFLIYVEKHRQCSQQRVCVCVFPEASGGSRGTEQRGVH